MGGRHYLDHASTSPLRPEVAATIADWAESGIVGDPGRVHTEGRLVRDALESARASLAALLGVGERSIVFTASGTEAINIVCAGFRGGTSAPGPILCAGVEHSAVRLASERVAPVVELPVDGLGRIDLDGLDELLGTAAPRLVHCQLANHEVGTVQPVAAVLERCTRAGVALHVDACAGFGQLPLDGLGRAFISVSAHKCGGPPGVGALVLPRTRRIPPLLVGGDQERGRRAGFENVPGILGFGALAEALAEPGRLEAEAGTARRRTARVLADVARIPGFSIFGDPEDRLPGTVCFGCEDVEAEPIVLGLDQAGIAVHSGSACSSEAFEPSPVLEAMGVPADHSIRCSVGWSTRDEDVDALLAVLPEVVGRLRSLRVS